MKWLTDRRLLIGCAILFSLCLLTAAFLFQQKLSAKYSTAGNGTSSTSVAAFGVTITDEGDGYGWTPLDPFSSDPVATYKCHIKNTSEVKVKCTPTVEGLPTDAVVEVDQSSLTPVELLPSGQTGSETDATVKLKLKNSSTYVSADDITYTGIKVNYKVEQMAN